MTTSNMVTRKLAVGMELEQCVGVGEGGLAAPRLGGSLVG